jgi:hypothetical protein
MRTGSGRTVSVVYAGRQNRQSSHTLAIDEALQDTPCDGVQLIQGCLWGPQVSRFCLSFFLSFFRSSVLPFFRSFIRSFVRSFTLSFTFSFWLTLSLSSCLSFSFFWSVLSSVLSFSHVVLHASTTTTTPPDSLQGLQQGDTMYTCTRALAGCNKSCHFTLCTPCLHKWINCTTTALQ